MKNVIVVEGERKADLLNSWGFTATCLDSGASSPIKDKYIQILGGMESIIILPDNDEPGLNYAYKIANALLSKVKNLKIVNLPGLQAKEDVIDWAKKPGNTKEELL
ncbi:MAG: zinc finger, CHC2-family protein [Candidatus Brocadiaceae bacterium]|nr:zinc finger, CHC2-family protein [Candidatus Brocadiaceae bacterium]